MTAPDISHRSYRLVGFVLSATGAMLFATKGILIKLIYRYGLDVTTLLAVRMALSLPVFLLVGAVEWARMPRARRPAGRDIALSALVGVLGYHVSSFLDFQGLRTLDAQLERLILFTYPFFVILFGRLIFRRPMSRHAIVGAGMSYAGLVVMFAGAPARLDPVILFGGGFVLAAAMSFALYQLFGFEMIRRLGPTLFTAIAMAGAGTTILTQFALTRPLALPVMAWQGWALVVMLAGLATVLPAFIMSAGTARIGAQGTAIVSALSPIATIGLAVVVLAEPFGWPEATGTALVIGGVALFTLREVRRRGAD